MYAVTAEPVMMWNCVGIVCRRLRATVVGSVAFE